MIEVFPTASFTRWAGRRDGRRRAAWTSSAILGLNVAGLPPRRLSQDDRDAIAAALTAYQYGVGDFEMYGDIVVPTRSPAESVEPDEAELDVFLIGYEEDGVFWLTAGSEVPDAAAAERYMGGGWRVVEEVRLGPTGHMVNVEDEEWAEWAGDHPKSRRGWRLIDSQAKEIFMDGEWVNNPLRREQPAQD